MNSQASKIISIILYLSGIAVASVLNGRSEFTSSLFSESPNSNFGKPDEKIISEIEPWLTLLPANDRAAWKAYVSRLSSINPGSSETMESANLKLTEKPCFSDVAAAFYGWLMKLDIQSDRLVVSDPSRLLGARPSLTDQLGEGVYKGIKPGMLWQKALEYSGNQPNLAMALIGLCGHDDAVRNPPQLIADRSETEIFRQTKKAVLARLRNKFLERLKTESHPKAKATLTLYLDQFDELTAPDRINGIMCSNSSLMLVPKSLGAEVDLSPGLKQKIISTQAPVAGGVILPAKVYHIIASAMNSCLLRSQTSTSFASLVLNPMAAKIYRGLMIKNQIESDDPLLASIDYENITRESIIPVVDAFNKVFPDRRPIEERMIGPTPEQAAFERNPRNAVYRYFSHLNLDGPISVERAYNIALNKIASFDAAELARKWWPKVSLPGVGQLYLPSSSRRPELRDVNIVSVLMRKTSDRCERAGWSVKRCDRAISVLNSWEIDFAWTEEQHRIGAAFGWRNCRRLTEGESVEDLACRARDGLKNKPLAPTETAR